MMMNKKNTHLFTVQIHATSDVCTADEETIEKW